MVRAKIPITWIKSDASRHVTFTKRKKGLKKKVEELAILCGVEVCMICFGPQAGKPSSVPYSWGLPGVAHVINKYRSLSKEEQDKKKLDNTSLLEQQIKKLKTELKLKVEQNRNLENERAYFLWDERLNGYGLDDLKQLADMVLDRTREVYDKISYVSQQQQDVLQGYGSCTLDQHAGALVAHGHIGNNAVGDFEGLNSCQLNHELMISSQGPYQQLVGNLNPYNNTADNPSSNLGTLVNANAQPYHHGLINQIPLLSLPAYIDDQKANISPLPLNHSAPAASSSFYLNANTMLPSSSDAPYVVNPKMKEQEQLPERHSLSNTLHPSLLKMKLYELMEPHMLLNTTWRQAVGLQMDHQYGAAYAGSPSSQEMHQAAGEHNAEDTQWSVGDNNVGSNGGAGPGDQETFDGSTQSISVENTHFDMSGSNTSGQSTGVTPAQFGGGSMINSVQPSILNLDIGQLAAMANEAEEPAMHEVKVKGGMLMWSLEEENNKMSNVYQANMLADEGATSLDKGLVELENDMEVTEKSNDASKPDLMKENNDAGTTCDVRMIGY